MKKQYTLRKLKLRMILPAIGVENELKNHNIMQVIWPPPSPTFWNLLSSPLNLIKSIIYLSFVIILSNRNKYCMLNHFIHSHTQTLYWEIQYCSAACNSLVETSMHQTPNDYFNNTIVTLLN